MVGWAARDAYVVHFPQEEAVQTADCERRVDFVKMPGRGNAQRLTIINHQSQRLAVVTGGDARPTINRHGFGALPVLDKGNHLVGIVSKADLVRAFGRVLQSRHEHFG